MRNRLLSKDNPSVMLAHDSSPYTGEPWMVASAFAVLLFTHCEYTVNSKSEFKIHLALRARIYTRLMFYVFVLCYMFYVLCLMLLVAFCSV